MNTGVLWPTAEDAEARVLRIQAKLHQWVADNPGRRFDDVFNLVHDPAVLVVAWARVRGNQGKRSAGVNGIRPDAIFLAQEWFLPALRQDLRAGQFTPMPSRERMIPKPGSSKRRPLGIPTTRGLRPGFDPAAPLSDDPGTGPLTLRPSAGANGLAICRPATYCGMVRQPRTQMREPTYFVLASLLDGPLHGYAIIQRAEHLSGGQIRLATGTLYTALDRLTAEGYVELVREEIVNGRMRRSYGLTPPGADALRTEAERMAAAASMVADRRQSPNTVRSAPKERPA